MLRSRFCPRGPSGSTEMEGKEGKVEKNWLWPMSQVNGSGDTCGVGFSCGASGLVSDKAKRKQNRMKGKNKKWNC